MALSRWLCTNNAKNMMVKIVHPGGRIELHDRPILAAEIMLQHPRYCVTHPHVFRQPWAVVTPDTVLMLGQKFYVVPISTVRKLQRGHLRRSPSPRRHSRRYQPMRNEDQDDEMGSACWLFNTTPKRSSCSKQSDDHDPNGSTTEEGANLTEDSWWSRLINPGTKIKAGGDGLSESSSMDMEDQSKIKGSPKRNNSAPIIPLFDHWQPSLASISEDREDERRSSDLKLRPLGRKWKAI